ncbi:MAG: shikimate kinase [Syntrophomonas sp.]|nr:shikimate kinase [Syntrophomonas sp.]
MGKNIVLIGFMGTGKSSVGIKLAQQLNMDFVDMDREIETIIGMPVAEIFRRYGELRFRSEELLLAQKLGVRNDTVISTGGGTVLAEENVAVLRQNGILICLDATPAQIFERVNRKKGTRPLLKKNISQEEIAAMLLAREKFYSCADIRVDTTAKNMDMVTTEILQMLGTGNRTEAIR